MGIPLDRFRVLVAQDVKSATAVSAHFGETFKSPASAFVGGCARVTMKSGAAVLNLYIPHEWRRDYPFLSSFVAGAAFAPLLNIPRMFQLGKVCRSRPSLQRMMSTERERLQRHLDASKALPQGKMLSCWP
jgi:hypothetical protein